jgi:hypothetical protein
MNSTTTKKATMQDIIKSIVKTNTLARIQDLCAANAIVNNDLAAYKTACIKLHGIVSESHSEVTMEDIASFTKAAFYARTEKAMAKAKLR